MKTLLALTALLAAIVWIVKFFCYHEGSLVFLCIALSALVFRILYSGTIVIK